MIVALTGGTGFVGSHFLDEAIAAGHSVRALTRQERRPRQGVQWIEGSLEDRGSLQQLVSGSDAVLHVAGVINALDRAGFDQGNVAGTLRMLAAATAAGVRRFVHVSSLAAREPEISMYGASKAEAESLVRESGLDWTIVRPPAVYGPRDREMLELFRMARRGMILLPPEGRFSVVHVGDLARLLAALAGTSEAQAIVEPDDARPNGWTHREFGQALASAVGRRAVTFSTPRSLLRACGSLDRLVRRERAKLTPDRAAYFCHPDWVVDPERRPPSGLWQPQIETAAGLASTAAWYREQGWL